MVSVLTWLTDKTDNINLVIEVAVGIVVTASGHQSLRSKQKIQQWLLSPESDPYVDRIVGKVAEGVSVPTVEDIIRALSVPTVEDIIRALPEPPRPFRQTGLDGRSHRRQSC